MGKGKNGPLFTRPEDAYGTSAGVEGFGIAFVLALGILTCLRARTHGVPARRCFWWLYVTLPILLLGYLLGTTAWGMYAFFYGPYKISYYYYNLFDHLVHARRIEPIGRFLRRIGAALCAIALAETAGSISLLSSRAGHNPLRTHSAVVFVCSTIASGLALAECVLVAQQANAKENPRLDDMFNKGLTAAAVAASTILVLIVGGITAALTAMKSARLATLYNNGVTAPIDGNVSIRMLSVLAGMLLIIVRMWGIAEVTQLLPQRRQKTESIGWFYLADPVIDQWGTALVLLLIYFVAVKEKEKGGLWPEENRQGSWQPEYVYFREAERTGQNGHQGDDQR